MSSTFTILGIAGSLRAGSYNRLALKAAQQLLPAGVQLDTFEIDGIPGFNQDQEKESPATVIELKRRVRAADAVLIATPEYNYSVPGVLKNAIDWASRPYGDSAWNGKPVAIIGASAGKLGTGRAQYHLRQMFVFLNMPVVLQPEVMIANCAEQFDAAGALKGEESKALIRKLLEALVQLARQHARKD
jgi:chromate reductase